MQRVVRYSPLLVVLHWLFAVLVVVALTGGALVLVKIPNSDPAKIPALRNHFEGGILLASLMLVRFLVRVRTSRPQRASTGNPALDRIASTTQLLFYPLVLAQAGVGLLLALQTHLPQVLFAGHGALPVSFWIYPARTAHYAISRLLMVAIALHISGGLYHSVILRDGLLRRMWFGRRFLETPDRDDSSRAAMTHPMEQKST